MFAATLVLPFKTRDDTTTDFYQPGIGIEHFAQSFHGMLEVLSGSPTAQMAQWQDLMASIREALPLPSDLRGRADIYPQHTGVVIADPDLVYAPRPAYLSLNAHTKALALANAAYLRSTGAPDVVVFQILPLSLSVNNRLPATVDGPSWPELLARYQLSSTTPDFLVLKHRDQPLAQHFRPIDEVDAAWDQTIVLPRAKSGLLWAEVQIDRSTIGNAIDFAYKAPQVLIELTTSGGASTSYQIVPGLGAAGFLVSPQITDTAGFLHLAQGTANLTAIQTGDIRSINFNSPGAPSGFWVPKIRIRFYDLSFSKVPKPAMSPTIPGESELIGRCIDCRYPGRLLLSPTPEKMNGNTKT